MGNPLHSTRNYLAFVITGTMPVAKYFMFGRPAAIGGRVRQLVRLGDLVQRNEVALGMLPEEEAALVPFFAFPHRVFLVPFDHDPRNIDHEHLLDGLPGQLELGPRCEFEIYNPSEI